jgi:thiol-disulfide isomerase/thioredoxin
MELGPAGFELKTLDGAVVTLETLRGQPAVVVFGGSWSLSTRKALPELKALAERYQGKARVYVAAVRQRDPNALATLAKQAGLDVPVLVSADTVAEQWRVAAFPSLFVLGPEGEYLHKPTTSKIEEMFATARTALDTALNMTPATKVPAAQESAPAASTDDAAGGSAVKPE